MKQLTENNFTTVGTRQFEIDTNLMTKTVGQVIADNNPVVTGDTTIADCLIKIESKPRYHLFNLLERVELCYGESNARVF